MSAPSATVPYWTLRPNAPPPGTRLGPLDEIAVDGAREYVFQRGPSRFRMFVVRTETAVFGYLNLCPHFSLPLNRKSDDFLSLDGTRIQCGQHYATFRIEDGLCISGACEGARLDPIPLELRDGAVLIADAER